MAATIDSSWDGCTVRVGKTLGGRMKVTVDLGFLTSNTYAPDDIDQIAEIDADKYRSAGAAAIGAIAGGALTGGVGFLIGAAIGGRRRTSASYLLVFKDGNHVAFGTNRKAEIALLDREIGARAARTAAAEAKAAANRLSED